MSPTDFTPATLTAQGTMVLILSADSVAAALLGALIETLGYSIRFANPSESVEQTVRRVRPKACFVDGEDPSACNEEILGRAAMRGISVIVFGTGHTLKRVDTLATEHDIQLLIVPPDADELDRTLRRAIQRWTR